MKSLLTLMIIIYYLTPFFNQEWILILITPLALVIGIRGLKNLLKKNHRTTRYILIYFVFCLLSSIWSDQPFYTIYFASLNIAILAGSLSLFKNTEKMDKDILSLLLTITLLEFITMYFQLQNRGFSGLTLFHGSGSLQAGLIYFVNKNLKIERTKIRLSTIFSGLAIAISTSLKIYLGILFIYIKNLKGYLKFLLLIISIIAVKNILDLEIDLGKIENLGGRLLPWSIMLQKIQSKILLGYGFPFGDEIRIDANFTIQNAHNMIIGSQLYIGILGPILIILIFSSVLKEIKSSQIKNGIWLIIISSLFNIGIAGKISGTLLATIFYIIYGIRKSDQKIL